MGPQSEGWTAFVHKSEQPECPMQAESQGKFSEHKEANKKAIAVPGE